MQRATQRVSTVRVVVCHSRVAFCFLLAAGCAVHINPVDGSLYTRVFLRPIPRHVQWLFTSPGGQVPANGAFYSEVRFSIEGGSDGIMYVAQVSCDGVLSNGSSPFQLRTSQYPSFSFWTGNTYSFWI